ncbi:hypothetical protein WJX81_002101 [Elliptochloris bilobata]|uniref:F-box domain-containing protein n=1 Tax=Elliptochloris bilobata TaxID=381761 RepID=A0AAW1RFJ9_9CHLO
MEPKLCERGRNVDCHAFAFCLRILTTTAALGEGNTAESCLRIKSCTEDKTGVLDLGLEWQEAQEAAPLSARAASSNSVGRSELAGGAALAMRPRWADELPDDLLRGVLARMPPAHLRVARLVCRGWAAATGRLMSRLQPERLQGGRLAARFPHLRALCLSHCGHRVVSIDRHVLQLQSTLGDCAMAEVACLTSLTQLSLRGCGGLTGAPGSGFECLRALQSLRSLNLSQCDSLQDGALDTVAALTALTSLSLRGCGGLTDAAPVRLAPLGQLRHLALGGPAITDAGLVQCIVLSALEHVCLASCRRVTDVGMAVLTALPALRRVTLSRCPAVSEAGLKLLLARTHLACAPAPLGCPRTFELIFTVLHNADMRLPGLPGLP